MTHETAQTREALVEVMARAMCSALTGNESAYDNPRNYERESFQMEAEAALLALEAAGVRLVPVEATEEMLEHGRDEGVIRLAERWKAAELYRVLLSASPYNAKDAP